MKSELIAALKAVSLEPIQIPTRVMRRLHTFCALSGADIDAVVFDLLGAAAINLLDGNDLFSLESAQQYGSWPRVTAEEWNERLNIAKEIVLI